MRLEELQAELAQWQAAFPGGRPEDLAVRTQEMQREAAAAAERAAQADSEAQQAAARAANADRARRELESKVGRGCAARGWNEVG